MASIDADHQIGEKGVPKISRRGILRNVSFNFAGAFVPLLLTLYTVPIYLHHVGASRYGVILVAWSLLGYFGFLDLGISRATTNALAKMAHLDAQGAKERVFWSSFLINGCLGTIGGLILYFLGSFLFLHVMKIAPEVQGETLAAMPYIAAMLPVTLMLGVGTGTAEAHERFGILNVIQMIGLVAGQILPLLVVLHYGPSLTLIMPTMLAVRIATFIAITIFAMRSSSIPFKPVIDFAVLRSLLSFGGWVTITNLVGPIMTDIDQFIIGSVKSVSTIPFYGIPLNIISRTQIIPTTLTRTLFPIFSRVEKVDGDKLMVSALSHLSTIMTVVYIGGIFVSGPFLNLWIGHEMMVQGGPVFRLVCLGAWANSLAFVLYSALQGQGRPRVVAAIHSCEVLPYVAGMWLLVHMYGIMGAAIAWTLRVVVDALALAWAARLGWNAVRTILPGFGALTASFTAAQWIGNVDLIQGSGLAALAAALFMGANMVFNPAFRDLLLSLRNWRQRLAIAR